MKKQVEAHSQPSKQIKIICAGLGRTGTLSLTEALTILGYNPYHYIDFNHASAWEGFVDGRKTSNNFYTTSADDIIDLVVHDGYNAVLENPTCEIFEDILKRFPDAKVILTVRDTPEKFEASWKVLMDTMQLTELPFSWNCPSFFQWIPLFRSLKKVRYFMGTTHLNLKNGALTHGWRQKPNGWLAEQYERHNKYIIDHVPKKQLLVFNVKEGWGPLCDFLQCQVPKDISFPHSKVNDTKALRRMRRIFQVAIYGWIPLGILSIAGPCFFFQRRSETQ